jgi:hypothetical protein
MKKTFHCQFSDGEHRNRYGLSAGAVSLSTVTLKKLVPWIYVFMSGMGVNFCYAADEPISIFTEL